MSSSVLIAHIKHQELLKDVWHNLADLPSSHMFPNLYTREFGLCKTCLSSETPDKALAAMANRVWHSWSHWSKAMASWTPRSDFWHCQPGAMSGRTPNKSVFWRTCDLWKIGTCFHPPEKKRTSNLRKDFAKRLEARFGKSSAYEVDAVDQECHIIRSTYHIISYHIISYHIIVYYIILYYIILY